MSTQGDRDGDRGTKTRKHTHIHTHKYSDAHIYTHTHALKMVNQNSENLIDRSRFNKIKLDHFF